MPDNTARRPPVKDGVTLYAHQQAAYERALIVFGYPPIKAEEVTPDADGSLQSVRKDDLQMPEAGV
jgi:hypothetical protein